MLRRAGLIAVMLMLLTANSVSAATTTVKMKNLYFTPRGVTVRLGNSVKWNNVSTKRHTATPTVNWSWTGVDVAAGTSSALVFPTQSGSFPYYCTFHPTKMKGKIKVPMKVSPPSGTTATLFTLTVGTEEAPGVLVHQVEGRLNGGAWQLKATNNDPQITILLTTAGTWELRTRLRYQLGGATSGWSPIKTVVVF